MVYVFSLFIFLVVHILVIFIFQETKFDVYIFYFSNKVNLHFLKFSSTNKTDLISELISAFFETVVVSRNSESYYYDDQWLE